MSSKTPKCIVCHKSVPLTKHYYQRKTCGPLCRAIIIQGKNIEAWKKIKPRLYPQSSKHVY